MSYSIARHVYKSPFGFGISKSLRKPPKERYSLSYLRGMARRAGLKMEIFATSKESTMIFIKRADEELVANGLNRAEAFRIINEEIERQTPKKPQPTFKILFMTDEGRCVDDYLGVYPNTQRPGSSYIKPIEMWLRNTLLHAEQMQLNGRIEKMPKLRRSEGARESLFELRKKLYRETHGTFRGVYQERLWTMIEQLLKIAEESL